MNSADIKGKFEGETQKNLQRIFSCAYSEAQKSGKRVIIFFDEFEELAGDRRRQTEDPSRSRCVPLLLQLMQGVKKDQKSDAVTVIGATNLLAQIDEAVQRRFTAKVLIGLPNRPAREGVLRMNLARLFNFPARPDEDRDSQKVKWDKSSSKFTGGGNYMTLLNAFYNPENSANITNIKMIQHGRDDGLYDAKMQQSTPKLSFNTVDEAIVSVAVLTRMYSASDLEQLVEDLARSVSSAVVASLENNTATKDNIFKATVRPPIIDIPKEIGKLRKLVERQPQLLMIKGICNRIDIAYRGGESGDIGGEPITYYLYANSTPSSLNTYSKVEIGTATIEKMEDNVDIQDPEFRTRIMACQLTPGHWIDALKNKAPSINTKEKLVGGE